MLIAPNSAEEEGHNAERGDGGGETKLRAGERGRKIEKAGKARDDMGGDVAMVL